MGMKKATKERITAAYEKGYGDGETAGRLRAEAGFEAVQMAGFTRIKALEEFAASLDSEADHE